MFYRVLAATAAFSLVLTGADLNSALFERLEYRSIGPASMGGRITDVEGVADDDFVVKESGDFTVG